MAIAVLSASCFIGQTAILTRRPLVFELADSPSYISLGARLASSPSPAHLFDAYRTPGYPLLLAAVDAAHLPLDAMVYLQAFLMVAVAFEIYVLTFRLTGSRVAAGLAGSLFALDVRLIDWERLIMTESVSLFLVTSTALAACCWIFGRSRLWAAVFGAASLAAVLTRPALIYLPVVWLVILLAADRRRWRAFAVCGVIVYATIAGYATVNERLNPGAGLSAVSNINLLGKVMEYGMQAEGDASRFPAVAAGIAGLPTGDRDPYDILKTNPAALGPNFVDAGAFGRAVILGHPTEYLAGSAGDLVQQWLAVPYAFIPAGAGRWLSLGLAALGLVVYAAYPALVLALAGLVVAWRRLSPRVALGLLGVVASVVGTLVTDALFSYLDFARLRTPVDGLALVATISIGVQLWLAVRPSSGGGKRMFVVS